MPSLAVKLVLGAIICGDNPVQSHTKDVPLPLIITVFVPKVTQDIGEPVFNSKLLGIFCTNVPV